MSLILDLSKSDMEDLQQKLTLNLEKHSIADLPSMAAKVLIDRSGSMSSHFATGWVSNLISMFVLAAHRQLRQSPQWRHGVHSGWRRWSVGR